jgi:hypothetical protein
MSNRKNDKRLAGSLILSFALEMALDWRGSLHVWRIKEWLHLLQNRL